MGEGNQATVCLEIGMNILYVGQKKDQLNMAVCRSPDC